MLRQHREQLLGRALLHVERPAVADQRRDVHEAVVGRLVGDAVGVARDARERASPPSGNTPVPSAHVWSLSSSASSAI